MTASQLRRLCRTGLVLAVVSLAGCGESTTTFNPVALSQSTDKIIAAMEGSPALQSLSVLGDKMILAFATVPERSDPWAATPAATGVFPQGTPLGKTFVYNAAQQTYVVSDRTEAPLNGVRFILYAVPVTTESSEIGHLDLLDEATALGVQAFLTGNTGPVVDYTASASVQRSGEQVSAATLSGKGSVSSGALTVTFDTLTQSYSVSSGISLHHALSVPEEGISIELEVSLLPTLAATLLAGTMTVQRGDDKTVVTGSGTLASFSGKITHDGKDVITFAGPSEAPVFLLASGAQPAPEEVAALKKLAEFTSALPCAVVTLLKPAAKLFIPAVPSLPCS